MKQLIEGEFFVELVQRKGMVEVESVTDEEGNDIGSIVVIVKDYDVEGVEASDEGIERDADGRLYWRRYL